MRVSLISLLCLLFLAPPIRGFPPPRPDEAFDTAAWVLSADVGKGVFLNRTVPPPTHPNGREVSIDVQFEQLFEAKVLEVLKAPAGARAPGVFSIFDSGQFSSRIEHAEPDRRMILFLIPAVLKTTIVAKYPVLKEAPRWEVLRAFRIDEQDPWGKDNHEGLRTLVTIKASKNAQDRLAAVKRIMQDTRSMLAMELAMTELRQSIQAEFMMGPKPSDPENGALQQAGVPGLLTKVGARWAEDKGSFPWRRKRIALDALSLAQMMGTKLEPALVLKLLGDSLEQMDSGAIHLLDNTSLPKVLATVRACVHATNPDVAEAAMQKLAELHPDLLETELQVKDIPPMRYIRGLELLQERGHVLRHPRQHQDLLNLDPDLRAPIAQALEGEIWLLQNALTSPIGRNLPPSEDWRRALRLLEPLVNGNNPAPLVNLLHQGGGIVPVRTCSPDPSSIVVSAFRTHHIPLRLVEGNYIPDYSGKASPPVSLRVQTPKKPWREGLPQSLEIEEVLQPGGIRVEHSGTWILWAFGPNNLSTSTSFQDQGPSQGALSNATTRKTHLDLNRLLSEAGPWTVSIGKAYDRDDRKDGGAWTGVVWSEPIKVLVE